MSNYGKILHEKPDLDLLRAKGYRAVDMHFHSKYSDGVNQVNFILKRAKKLGVGVSITDHDQVKGSLLAAGSRGVLCIPGVEVTTKEGAHALFYFRRKKELEGFHEEHIKPYRKRMSPFLMLRAIELIERSREYNAVTVMPHPYGVAWTGMMNCIKKKMIAPEAVDKIDGIEVICGANQRAANKKAIELALRLKDKAITGGTDGHIFYELGQTVTAASWNVQTAEEFLEEVLKKRTVVIGKETKFFRKYLSHSTKGTARYQYTLGYVRKYLKYGKHSLKERLKIR